MQPWKVKGKVGEFMPPDFKTKYNAIVIQQHGTGTIENYDIKTE